MKSGSYWLWDHNDFISAEWLNEGELGDCPYCSLPLIAIVDTSTAKVYYHAKEIRCVVRK